MMPDLTGKSHEMALELISGADLVCILQKIQKRTKKSKKNSLKAIKMVFLIFYDFLSFFKPLESFF